MFLLDFYVRFVTLFGTGVPIGGFFQLNRLDIKRLVEKLKLADKPGSVKFVRKQTATIIHLGQQSLTGSSNTPDLNVGHAIRDPIWSCSGWSLPCRILLPATRCALTAPFHPYRFVTNNKQAVFSLLHLSSARAAQALPGTLPYGARTFLPSEIHA